MLLSNQPKHVYYINVSGRPWVAPSAWSLVGVRGSKAIQKLLEKFLKLMGVQLIWLKCLVQCRAHKKNSINVSYTITTLYFSMEMGSVSWLFVYMNRRLLARRPAEEWILSKDSMEVRPHSSPESNQFQEWGSQFMEPPVIPEGQGRPQQSSQPEPEKVLLWAEGGMPISMAPVPPRNTLPGSCWLHCLSPHLSERTYACLFIAVSRCLALTFNAH